MIEKVGLKLDDIKQPRRVMFVFLLIWLVINILQAFFTELAHDEAYYWLYAQHLAWGYFDHPPLIALLIKAGYSIFPNELGVRLFPLLMGAGTLYLIYLLSEETLKSISTLIMLLVSVVMIHSHVGGFLAIPDLPVIFFAALFLYLYKKYLKYNTYGLALLLGLAGTAMLYSKYHGVLVLIFTLAANVSILRRRSFYIIPVVIAVGMLPHLFWQMQNNFPTFEYHLVSRSQAYKIEYTLNYLVGQVLLAGPFIGLLLFYFAAKAKSTPISFDRILKVNFYGFFIFFLFMSFKGHVEAHWTAIGYIPLLLLAVNNIAAKERAKKWVRILFIPTLILFLITRILLVVDLLPPHINLGKEFHNWDSWAKEIKAASGERKVIFTSTFQRPAKYSFYTGGEFAHSLNMIWYRKNQFDLWGYTDSVQGKDVILFGMGPAEDSLKTSANESYSYRLIDNFVSYNNIPVLIENKDIGAIASDSVSISVKVVNNRPDSIFLDQNKGLSPRFCMALYNGKKFLPLQYLDFIQEPLSPGDTLSYNLKFIAPSIKGKYSCYLAIVNNGILPGFNSKAFILEVEE